MRVTHHATLTLVAASLLSSCAWGAMSESARVERVQSRATFDLDCEAGVRVRKITENSYGAVGCGHRATYVMSQCSDVDFERSCTVVLNAVGGESGPLEPRDRPTR